MSARPPAKTKPKAPAKGVSRPVIVGTTAAQAAAKAKASATAAAAAAAKVAATKAAAAAAAKKVADQKASAAAAALTTDTGYTQIINSTLASWGLSSLASTVTNLGKDSANTSDIIYMKLQDTPEWKARFAGNAQRVASGLGVLSPAEYIALEAQYKSTLRQYGLPDGFYDDKNATDNWIGGDVSADEVAQRAQDAATLIYNSPKSAMDAWNNYYGGGTGGAIASILDMNVAEPLVQQHVMAAQIGGSALDQGLSTAASNAERYASEGVTLAGAQKGFSDIKQRLATDTAASSRFGTQFGQADEEAATFDQSGAALNKQSTLYAEESSLFSGHGTASSTSNDTGTNY